MTEPFFIMGAQRSGTTLLSVMLDRHPDITIDGNSVVFRLVNCLGWYKDVFPFNAQHEPEQILSWLIENDYKGRLAAFLDFKNIGQYPDLRSLIQQGIDNRIYERGAQIFGDKAPDMEHFLGELLLLIPNAKIIHMVRDGRAAAYSKSNRTDKHWLLAAQEWTDSVSLGIQHQAMLGNDRYALVRYEDLLLDSENILKGICDFLGLPFSEELLMTKEQEGEANSYVSATLDTSKIHAYQSKFSKAQLMKIEQVQGPLLRHFGYDLLHAQTATAYRPLSTLKRFRLSQLGHLKELFKGRQTGMVDRKNVQLKVPFKTRLKHFVLYLGYDLMPKRVYRRVFRKRWIKDLHIPPGT